MLKIVDLHNHTTRCNHAEGSVDEYVKKAILEEIDIFGFSDHAPMPTIQVHLQKQTARLNLNSKTL